MQYLQRCCKSPQSRLSVQSKRKENSDDLRLQEDLSIKTINTRAILYALEPCATVQQSLWIRAD